MSSSQPLPRRFEILLPRRFNDGQPVPEESIADTLMELRRYVGAVSWETQVIQGIWEHAGKSYEDALLRLYVDVADTPENRQFFVDLKERLKARYQQVEIRVTTYIIEVV